MLACLAVRIRARNMLLFAFPLLLPLFKKSRPKKKNQGNHRISERGRRTISLLYVNILPEAFPQRCLAAFSRAGCIPELLCIAQQLCLPSSPFNLCIRMFCRRLRWCWRGARGVKGRNVCWIWRRGVDGPTGAGKRREDGGGSASCSSGAKEPRKRLW